MVQLAVLIAIMLILAFTPLGYLRIGPLAISPDDHSRSNRCNDLRTRRRSRTGTGILDLLAFYQCFAGDPFWSSFGSNESVFHFLVCIPTRTLMGWLSGVIFKALWKIDKTKTVTLLFRDRSAGSI